MAETRRRVAKKTRTSTKPKQRLVKVNPDDISSGDTVEIGVTFEVKTSDRQSVWLKAGVTTTVRDDEEPGNARERAIRYADKSIERMADEWGEQ